MLHIFLWLLIKLSKSHPVMLSLCCSHRCVCVYTQTVSLPTCQRFSLFCPSQLLIKLTRAPMRQSNTILLTLDVYVLFLSLWYFQFFCLWALSAVFFFTLTFHPWVINTGLKNPGHPGSCGSSVSTSLSIHLCQCLCSGIFFCPVYTYIPSMAPAPPLLKNDFACLD